MKRIAILMMLGGVLLLANTVIDKLSVDALGMAIGMTLGVLAGVPTAALVLLARRRDDEDGGTDEDYGPPVTISQYPPAQPYSYIAPQPVVIVCREDVTPYYNGARRLMGMEPLPSRADQGPTTLTAQQIAELEDYIEFQKAGGIRQVDPRHFIVRFNGEVR